MSSRGNFLEGNDSFREQSLRIVRVSDAFAAQKKFQTNNNFFFYKNELEDNFNQYFSGAGGSGGAGPHGNGAPPRESVVVQPTPGKCA